MDFTAFFIKRPVATTLLMAGIFLFGIMGYYSLPVNDLPNVDFPTISISASLPGASPETMAASVATPLEKELGTIAGIDSITSQSSQGQTRITVQFDLDRDIDAAAQDVQSAISSATRRLPAGMSSPPSYRKVNPAEQPILFISFSSPTLPLSQVNEYAETLVGQRISMLKGVAQVQVWGQQKYAVRARLDPRLLAFRGIALEEVADAILLGNVLTPTGTLDGVSRSQSIQTNSQLLSAAEFRPLIVTWRNGSPVRLAELGDIEDSVEQDKAAAWRDNNRSVTLAVERQPGANTIEVVDAVREILPVIKAQIPASVDINIQYDRSQAIRESVADVKFTLALTVVLVVGVIFIFLRTASATIIPSLALPISIIGTFAAMKLLGYSIDTISLMALTLAVGFVVDDAIVMLENIVRHLEMGKTPLQASIDGAREITFTILSMTISLAAVFLPVLFMGGIIGRLFQEFAAVIMIAIALSGVAALTLIPMLCSRFLSSRIRDEGRSNRFYQWLETSFERLAELYERSLKFCLRHHRVTFAFSLFLLGLTAFLFVITPKGFLPSADTGRLMVFTEANQSISFEGMVKEQRQLQQIIMQHPDLDSTMSMIGSGSMGRNGGMISVNLKDFKERESSADEVADQLRPQINNLPGIKAFVVNPPLINIGGRMGKGLYQYTLQHPDLEILYQNAALFEEELRSLPILQEVSSDMQLNNPELRVDINRDKASALGISAQSIDRTLQLAFASGEVSTIYAPVNDYQVIMELKPEFRRDAAVLSSYVYVRSKDGNLVPLSTIVSLRQAAGPLMVNHSGQFPSVTFGFNLRPGVSLGEAVRQVEDLAEETLPADIIKQFQGTAQAFQDSLGGMAVLLALSILVIYMVLGILYESFIHPITILSGLPSAACGAMITLLIFGVDLSLYSFVGIIMLVGIVKKNAIMMIDFALESRRTGRKSAGEAIFEGCMIRFRPIMMTTMAALMGTLPIAIGFGVGGEARQPLGLAVVGGLLFSQIVTLYFTPIYFIYLDKFARAGSFRLRRLASAVNLHSDKEK
ncbi:MAG: efflux RND transporter permease subunit [Desulfovibrionaceae bacterium]|nr:efflux RND transporter permease subunit [Desulfovibrionaceae bacterium]